MSPRCDRPEAGDATGRARSGADAVGAHHAVDAISQGRRSVGQRTCKAQLWGALSPHGRLLIMSPQILDELIISGEMQESSKKSVLRVVSQSDAIEEAENSEDVSAV